MLVVWNYSPSSSIGTLSAGREPVADESRPGKYAAIPIHLVITTSPYALGFVSGQNQQALFPNVPVVFALVSAGELPRSRCRTT